MYLLNCEKHVLNHCLHSLLIISFGTSRQLLGEIINVFCIARSPSLDRFWQTGSCDSLISWKFESTPGWWRLSQFMFSVADFATFAPHGYALLCFGMTWCQFECLFIVSWAQWCCWQYSAEQMPWFLCTIFFFFSIDNAFHDTTGIWKNVLRMQAYISYHAGILA